MELVLLVWVIDLLLNVDNFLAAMLICIAGLSAVYFLIAGLASIGGDYSSQDCKRHLKKYVPYKTIIAALVITWLIPSSQTMKYMGAAYLVQTTFESEFVQETATLSQKAIINQLTVWAEDTPDIVPVLEELGVEVKEKALQEVSEVVESVSNIKEEK